ncbi:hypothetical protein KAR91_40660 [Candidatus Pacearchaeota archaeon]|nr:hypothetical protein [Candidatus Pacearchaeota archaeon]
MVKVKYKYNPIVEEIFLYKRKKQELVVTASYAYGNIVCFDLNGTYVDNWVSGYFKETKSFKKVGTLIKPRWDKYKLSWALCERKIKRNISHE